MNRYVTYLFMGAPGSGKGTQGKALGTVPRFFHCACGEVFRSLDLRTPLGQKFVEYSSKGLLVPDDLTVELWRTKIEAQVLEAEFKPDIDALVLDGIPRNVNQAKLMENLHRRLKGIDLGHQAGIKIQYGLGLRLISSQTLPDHLFTGVIEPVVFDGAFS